MNRNQQLSNINRSRKRLAALADRERTQKALENSRIFRFIGWGGFDGKKLRLIVLKP